MNNKNWEQAIDIFQQCIRYCPRHFQSYGNMGICYGQLGQKSQAILALDKAIEIDPKYELAIVNRVLVESMKEGEKNSQGKVTMIEYSKGYGQKKKSYIQTIVQQCKNLLP
jgi:tetratricopeptide (TPR) repeat protein